MKLAKRIAALALCLCMLCGLPLSVNAADDITLQSATIVNTTDAKVTLEVAFSAPVMVKKNSDIYLLSQEANGGCNKGTTFQSWNAITKAVNDTDADGYSTTWTFEYYKCFSCATNTRDAVTQHGADMLAKAWFTIGNNGTYDTEAGYIGTERIEGLNGAKVKKDDGKTHTAVKVSGQPSITLDKAEFVSVNDDNTVSVDVTFSAPVKVRSNSSTNFMSQAAFEECNGSDKFCSWAPTAYTPQDDEDGDGFATTWRYNFSVCSRCGTSHGEEVYKKAVFSFQNNTGQGDTADAVGIQRVMGLNGEAVAKNDGQNYAAIQLTVDEPEVEPITLNSATVVAADSTGYTVKAVFSAPVTLNKNFVVTIGDHKEGGCAANFCQDYKVLSTEADGATVTIKFDYCLNADYKEAHRALWLDENGNYKVPANAYLYMSDFGGNHVKDSGVMSSATIVGADGTTPVAVTGLKNAGANNEYGELYVQLIDEIPEPEPEEPVVEPITLNSATVVAADSTGYTVKAVFSAPVTLNKNFTVMIGSHVEGSCSDTVCQDWKVLSTEADGATVTIKFDYCTNATYRAAHRALWLDENGNYKVPANAYLWMNDRDKTHVEGSGVMATDAIVGADGTTPVALTDTGKFAGKEYGNLYVALTDEIPEPPAPLVELTDVTIGDYTADASGHRLYSVTMTFSDYVYVNEAKKGNFEMTVNEAGGSGKFQVWGDANTTFAYNDTKDVAGETFAKQVTITLLVPNFSNQKGVAAFITNLSDMGVRISSNATDVIKDELGRSLKATHGTSVIFIKASNTATVGQSLTLDKGITSGGDFTVPAGMTLDLNGNTITANSVVAYGELIDSSNGKGAIIAPEGAVLLNGSDDIVALYSTDRYKLFECSTTYKVKTVDNVAKFGVALKIGGDTFNQEAYWLLQAQGSGFSLTFNFELSNGQKLELQVPNNYLIKYYNTVKANADAFDEYFIIANVKGIDQMEDGMTLTCTPTLTFAAGSQTVAAQTYTHTVSE